MAKAACILSFFQHYSNHFHTAMIQLGDNIQRCPKKVSSSVNWVFASTAPPPADNPVASHFCTQIPQAQSNQRSLIMADFDLISYTCPLRNWNFKERLDIRM